MKKQDVYSEIRINSEAHGKCQPKLDPHHALTCKSPHQIVVATLLTRSRLLLDGMTSCMQACAHIQVCMQMQRMESQALIYLNLQQEAVALS